MREILPPIREYCRQNQLPFTDRLGEQLVRYAEFLAEYNQKVNLTAITAPQEMAVKHFIDSLTLAAVAAPSGRLLDLGTGAGFPGMVMKLLYPSLEVTLMDSVGKKVEFLRLLSAELDVSVTLLCGRAEDFGHDPTLRERFDFVTARAVAALPTLCEYCLPFVRVGGCFAAMKGAEHAAELAEARAAIETLGGKAERSAEQLLPDGSRRGIILIKKISQSSPKYPRNGSQISKNPL